jgi:hypothetical protein
MEKIKEKEVEKKKKVIGTKTEVWTENIRPTQPVIIHIRNDRPSMKKYITYQYIKHIYKEDKQTGAKEYSQTKITKEMEEVPLRQSDIDYLRMVELKESINRDVNEIDLTEIKNKKDVLAFACKNNKSNKEKMRRAVSLCKRIL